MALYLSLIGLGWLLAAYSSVLWLRKYPGEPVGQGRNPRRGWQSNAVLAGAALVGVYGAVGLIYKYHWGGWIISVGILVPLVTITSIAPVLTRRWQLRRSAAGAVGLDSAAGVPPSA